MPISNKVKGVLSLIQSLLITFGAAQMFSDPHSMIGLAVSLSAALIGAAKHWADTYDTPQADVPQGPTST